MTGRQIPANLAFHYLLVLGLKGQQITSHSSAFSPARTLRCPHLFALAAPLCAVTSMCCAFLQQPAPAAACALPSELRVTGLSALLQQSQSVHGTLLEFFEKNNMDIMILGRLQTLQQHVVLRMCMLCLAWHEQEHAAITLIEAAAACLKAEVPLEVGRPVEAV